MAEVIVDTPNGKDVFYDIYDAKQVEDGVLISHYGQPDELIEGATLVEKKPL
jgi:hypothetical protein